MTAALPERPPSLAPPSLAPPSLANAEWLQRHQTQRVLAMLSADGGAARVVGGAVRNELLGRPVADIDIATTLEPTEVIARAARAGLRPVPTGLAHGTVTVVCDHHGFEVTTLREDVETFGRHATVAFTDDWEADARRRDFTINALYCDADGRLHDPVGGYPDLIDGRVRFIGDPSARIGEDYLRILRLFRFHAQYGKTGPEPADLTASVRLRSGLTALSRERIHGELMRLLVAPGAVATITLMRDLGLLTLIVPAAPRLGVLHALATLDRDFGRLPDAALRLAALAVSVREDGERLATRLALSNAERGTLADAADLMTGAAGRPLAVPHASSVKANVYREGNAATERRVLLTAALAFAAGAPITAGDWRGALTLAATFTAPRFPLNGHDVRARGITIGPEFGRLLRAVEDAWIENDFADDRAALLVRLDQAIAGRTLIG